MLSDKLIQRELNRILQRRVAFMELMPKPAPLPWHRRQWNLLRYRISEMRERLGEIIAGRRFDDY